MNNHESTHLAETQTLVTQKQAESQIEVVVLAAEAKVKALLDRYEQQTAETACLKAAATLNSSVTHAERMAKNYINQHMPSTEVFQEAVSIRAYYKAEQRHFQPGQEGLDWCTSEKEVLDVSPFGD
jgi:hypothetical protein